MTFYCSAPSCLPVHPPACQCTLLPPEALVDARELAGAGSEWTLRAVACVEVEAELVAAKRKMQGPRGRGRGVERGQRERANRGERDSHEQNEAHAGEEELYTA